MSKVSDSVTEHAETILVVDGDILVRSALAAYLRHCGYQVVEVSSATEATALLTEPSLCIDTVFSEVDLPGGINGFSLSRWVRRNRPGMHVVLAGSPRKAAAVAGDLCEEGPHMQKPYEPQQVVEWIKRLRASAVDGNGKVGA